MFKTPLGHGSHDGPEGVAQVCETVLCFGRNDWVLFARDEAPGFEFAEFFREDAVAYGGTGATEGRKAQWFVADEGPNDPGFPPSTEDTGGEGYGAWVGEIHGTDANKIIRTCKKLVLAV